MDLMEIRPDASSTVRTASGWMRRVASILATAKIIESGECANFVRPHFSRPAVVHHLPGVTKAGTGTRVTIHSRHVPD